MPNEPSGAAVRGRREYDRLPRRSRDARGRALAAVARMRTTGVSLKQAAAIERTSPATVRRYAGPALTRRGARDVATIADRLFRRMSVLTPDGRKEIDVRGSRAASRIARHWNAIDHYLATGDRGQLERFAGVRLGGVEFASRPQDIETHHHRGELVIDDIYPDR